MAWGWAGSPSTTSRPTALTSKHALATQWRSVANSAKRTNHSGGSSRTAIRFSAWLTGRVGLRVQQRKHMPSPCLRARAPHCEQARAGNGGEGRREHDPHQPVSDRMNPGRPQRGQGDLAAMSSPRTRQVRHRFPVLNRRTCPHTSQVREQRTQRPVSASRRRNSSQLGQSPRRADSRSAARQRWQSVSALKPIPPPQRTQSASLKAAASNVPGRTWPQLASSWPASAWPPPG